VEISLEEALKLRTHPNLEVFLASLPLAFKDSELQLLNWKWKEEKLD
jgi:hypothetical protein